MSPSGFAAGTRYTPVPDPLLGPLLEEIQDLAELKCTMRVVYLLHQRRGASRYIPEEELLSDPVLVAGLGAPDRSTEDYIRQGLSLAVARGTFLAVRREQGSTTRRFLFLNDEAGRKAVERLQTCDLPEDAEPLEESLPVGQKPNIFRLYEENIGMLTPILADEMKEAEREYRWEWIEDAFKLAVARNVRNWRYIQAILKRWATEGKDDGESGRHTAEASDQEGLREYLRKRGRLPGS